VQKSLMQGAVYWLLAAVTVVAGVSVCLFVCARAFVCNSLFSGLLREYCVRTWKRLFYPTPLHIQQELCSVQRRGHDNAPLSAPPPAAASGGASHSGFELQTRPPQM
jgi:hypothetical protein